MAGIIASGEGEATYVPCLSRCVSVTWKHKPGGVNCTYALLVVAKGITVTAGKQNSRVSLIQCGPYYPILVQTGLIQHT